MDGHPWSGPMWVTEMWRSGRVREVDERILRLLTYSFPNGMHASQWNYGQASSPLPFELKSWSSAPETVGSRAGSSPASQIGWAPTQVGSTFWQMIDAPHAVSLRHSESGMQPFTSDQPS